MGLAFISGNLDSKPIKDLLLEYKADVVEEELVDEEAEVIVSFLGDGSFHSALTFGSNLNLLYPSLLEYSHAAQNIDQFLTKQLLES